jgi:hypothetical protein
MASFISKPVTSYVRDELLAEMGGGLVGLVTARTIGRDCTSKGCLKDGEEVQAAFMGPPPVPMARAHCPARTARIAVRREPVSVVKFP